MDSSAIPAHVHSHLGQEAQVRLQHRRPLSTGDLPLAQGVVVVGGVCVCIPVHMGRNPSGRVHGWAGLSVSAVSLIDCTARKRYSSEFTTTLRPLLLLHQIVL